MFGQRPDEEFINDPSSVGRLGTSRTHWMLILLILAGIGVFLAWAYLFEIEEVTRGEGRVVPAQQVQTVQSLDAGLVSSIDVHEGDIVEEGQTLMTIDDTAATAQLGELREREAGLLAEEIRLRAEVAFDRTPEFPDALEKRAPQAVLAELDVLNSRFDQYDNEIGVLQNKLIQKRAQLDELLARRAKLQAVIAPLEEEVALTRVLAANRAVPKIELLRLESRLAELQGDLAVGRAQEPTLKAAIAEAESELNVAKSAYIVSARQRLATLGVELAVVREGIRAATDKVTRTALRAPIRGTVNVVSVSTLGQVVEPGRPLVEIVPLDDSLLIEVEIAPQDVAFIQPGEKASVKISAYDYLLYGALQGQVDRIGADTVETAEGRDFFRVTIKTETTALEHAGQQYPVSPGMRATVDIQTGRRSVLSYLMAPVLRLQSEALRER